MSSSIETKPEGNRSHAAAVIVVLPKLFRQFEWLRLFTNFEYSKSNVFEKSGFFEYSNSNTLRNAIFKVLEFGYEKCDFWIFEFENIRKTRSFEYTNSNTFENAILWIFEFMYSISNKNHRISIRIGHSSTIIMYMCFYGFKRSLRYTPYFTAQEKPQHFALQPSQRWGKVVSLWVSYISIIFEVRQVASEKLWIFLVENREPYEQRSTLSVKYRYTTSLEQQIRLLELENHFL